MTERRYFSSIEEIIEPPNLIEIQTKSFHDFLQKNVAPSQRIDFGLQAVFKDIFPITSYDDSIALEFVEYDIEPCAHTALECTRTGKTYSVPLYVTFNLRDHAGNNQERVYMGELPMMTPAGTFIINGAERVIISQLHRSPGVCFEKSKHTNGKDLYSFRIIPDTGSWLEAQFDSADLLYIYLDRRRRRRKFLASTFLRVLGYPEDKDIIPFFYQIQELDLTQPIDGELLSVMLPFENIKEGNTLLSRKYEALSPAIIEQLLALGIDKVPVIDSRENPTFLKTLQKDKSFDEESALKEIYRKLRPGDPSTSANSRALIDRLFFDSKRYNLTRVGRFKLNKRLKIDVDANKRILDSKDFLYSLKHLFEIVKGVEPVDDIDHLGNRRIRSVGELFANQCAIGLSRTERLIKERMTLFDVNVEGLTPKKLINPKALSAVIRDFFGRSQLSQFMDQTNPLAELTHKRRLSALGPGGLNRDRAGFEVRDVHTSHYSRVCPIETPEGPNIGLINTMCAYSRVNDYGFIEAPFRKVINGKVTNQIEFFDANKEEEFLIAQANNLINKDGEFLEPSRVTARDKGEFIEVEAKDLDYMDVSPKQLVSVSAGLIPFLEHDDANRALMGSNMQRQGVPLLVSEAPYVGTGLEAKAAKDSRALLLSESEGVVACATAEVIIVTKDGSCPFSDAQILSDFESLESDIEQGIYVYPLCKFMRSNSGTCMNQKIIVKSGQKVGIGTVLADGANTDNGELALGRNVLVAFMPWNGYNFEDAIVISEKVVKEDIYTSIHISEFECIARDTKLGPEEITRDIPSVGEEALKNLDHDGIIRIGAEVKPRDILIGKVTPKSETEVAPEERLLRAIFGEKAADVKDSSLRVPSGCTGIVQDVRITARGIGKKKNSEVNQNELKKQFKKINTEYKKKREQLTEQLTEKLSDILLGEKIPLDVVNAQSGEIIIPANRKITKTLLRRLANIYDHIDIDNSPIRNKIFEIIQSFESRFEKLDNDREHRLDQIESGDEFDLGVIKEVKVYIATKRKLSVGDKMAGRHGNKGVVATIVPEEDMPFLEDGTPVEICLNPLGVPSRMNVGQVLETHLGVAAKALGFNVASPIFDGIPESKIWELVSEAKQQPGYEWVGDGKDGSVAGKSTLYDGRTGDAIHQPVVVGYIYMLKLGHLVADKLHARATGPYSLVAQQPLGGKAQYGGQRFGEMEVWALEAYGAAYSLQEILTVKSDDVQGRTRIYESIVRGDNILQSGIPESFNVLTKEIMSLGMEVKLGSDTDVEDNQTTDDDDFSIEDLIL